ncbi:ADP-heptose:LPS heptosyltransferase [Spirosomataceae bacterium TFI 002]|nr:ADP-heptose:LPS heptosyltransferase [Spirosomataceae bacterium TFI 002]
MKTFIVMRFSAMGDVILMLPVLADASSRYPQHRFIVVTRPKFTTFFAGYPNIECFPVDLLNEYKGIGGLWKLTRTLKKKYSPSAILDLHQHLRTGILKLFLKPIPSFTLDKGRAAKKALTRKDNKALLRLPHVTLRYADVFLKAGLPLDLENNTTQNFFKDLDPIPLKKTKQRIGIAPFATHKGKILPFEKIEALVQELSSLQHFEILLFGGGKKEEDLLQQLAQNKENVISTAGNYTLNQELSLISSLNVMICMDSSNMHMAAMAGVPTVSIWGATHSYAGFGPYNQSEDSFIQIPTSELTCRPCSVYGNTLCHRGDYACLERITVRMISEKVERILA